MRANAAARYSQTTEKLRKLQEEGQAYERQLEQISGEHRTLEALIALDDRRIAAAVPAAAEEKHDEETSVIPPAPETSKPAAKPAKEKQHVN